MYYTVPNVLFHEIDHLNIESTIKQIGKALINDHLHVSKVSWKFHIPTNLLFSSKLPVKFAFFLKSNLLF